MSKNLYEGMFLFDSNVASKDWAEIESHIQGLFDKHGAELAYSERWPDRRLAYEIKGVKKGTYYLTYFHAEPEVIEPLRRDVQLSERILRMMIIQEEGVEQEMEGRKNKEIDIPPAEISFGRDRGFDSGGRFRRDGGGRSSDSRGRSGDRDRSERRGRERDRERSSESGDAGRSSSKKEAAETS